MRLAWSCSFAVLLVLSGSRLAVAAVPDDATLEAARTLGYSAVSDYEAGNFQRASEKLESAYAVVKVPSLGLWSARALAKLGRLVEADRRYTEVVSLSVGAGDAEIQRQAQVEAQQELEALKPTIPRLTIEIRGAVRDKAAVFLDGRPVAHEQLRSFIRVDPGEHQVMVDHAGEQRQRGVTMTPGSRETLVIEFESPKAVPAPVDRAPAEPTHEENPWAIAVSADAIFVEPAPSGAALRVGLTPATGLAGEIGAVVAGSALGGWLGLRIPLLETSFDVALVPTGSVLATSDGAFVVLEAEGRVRMKASERLRLFGGIAPEWFVLRPSPAVPLALRVSAGVLYSL